MLKGLERPVGPLRIRKTRMAGAGDVLLADLSGASKASVACVQTKRGYVVVAPKELGGIQEVPAGSLTDALHARVEELGRSIGRRKLKSQKGRRKGS